MTDKNPNILHNLNPQQIEAVKHFAGPALVVAGPGSGKTRVLTHRIAYLINEHGVEQTKILCVTFTNKAAGEIQERIARLLGKTNKLSWSGTFHSICSRILRKDGFHLGIPFSYVIYDRDDSISLVKKVIKDFGMDSKQVKAAAILGMISSAKSELVNPETYEKFAQGYFQRSAAKIYYEYDKRLRESNALDFDDLLFSVVKLFKKEPGVLEKYQTMFEYILVDEYQDTNHAQYILTKLLAEKNKNLYVVGDMSQAIYSFRGADYRNILNFEKDYPEAAIYNLEKNYRSTQNILDAAKNVIKNNTSHINLDLWTENGEGEKIISYLGATDLDESLFVAENIVKMHNEKNTYSDIAVLYRTNAQSRNLEEHLIKNNIPYKIVGGLRFYSRKEVKDIIAYLRVVHNPKDASSWERIINVPPRKIGQKSIEIISRNGWDIEEIKEKTKLQIDRWFGDREVLSTLELMDVILDDTKYLQWLDDGTDEGKSRVENIKELRTVAQQFVNLEEFLENVALIESSNRANPDQYDSVTLMTVHASKGLEFPIVFIVGMEEGLFPHMNSIMEKEQIEEERRLCYVAITRAKTQVYLTRTQSRLYFGSRQSNLPSRFLLEIPESLISRVGQKEPEYEKRSGSNIDDYFDDLEMHRQNFNWE